MTFSSPVATAEFSTFASIFDMDMLTYPLGAAF